MILPWEKAVLTLWEALMLVVAETNRNGPQIASQAGDYWDWLGLRFSEDKTGFKTFAEAQRKMREWAAEGRLRGLVGNTEISRREVISIFRRAAFRARRAGAVDVLVYADDIRKLCAEAAQAMREKLPKATYEEVAAEYQRYVAERLLVLSAKEEGAEIARRLGKRIDRDEFGAMRQNFTQADLRSGPRKELRHEPILQK
jgi:hypothetical protein